MSPMVRSSGNNFTKTDLTDEPLRITQKDIQLSHLLEFYKLELLGVLPKISSLSLKAKTKHPLKYP